MSFIYIYLLLCELCCGILEDVSMEKFEGDVSLVCSYLVEMAHFFLCIHVCLVAFTLCSPLWAFMVLPNLHQKVFSVHSCVCGCLYCVLPSGPLILLFCQNYVKKYAKRLEVILFFILLLSYLKNFSFLWKRSFFFF